MVMDKEKLRFEAKAISAATKLGASLEDKDAVTYLDLLFEEWKKTGGASVDVSNWLLKRLEGAFKSASTPPDWIEEDFTWPFLDNKPMIFLIQFSHPKSGPLAEELSAGETVYLFAGRKSEDGITRLVYKTVSQFENGY